MRAWVAYWHGVSKMEIAELAEGLEKAQRAVTGGDTNETAHH
jgi:hypothetical protein